MKQVTAIVVGAGSRGSGFSAYAQECPQELKIVGVCEPREFHRNKMQRLYNIPENRTFSDWSELAAQPKLADCVFICTPDQLHKAPAIMFAKLGYHLLLEKPMAVTYEDCQEIVKTCCEHKVLLAVCHVLRYAPQAQKIKSLIASGAIGDVVNIQLLEPVGFWHFAHSFVRGNWHSEKKSSFSLLTKSCHDVDLISDWMNGLKCTAISSFGSLKHFSPANKPAGAASRCLDCSVETSCAYSAKKIYLDTVKRGYTGWPVHVITDVPDIESVTEALRSGPYGKCVYEGHNDVCDNQIVNFQFEGGATASFTMVAFTDKICARQAHIFGTKGEIQCDFDQNRPEVIHFDFLSKNRHIYDLDDECSAGLKSKLSAHFGADYFTLTSFLEAVSTNNSEKILTGPDETLRSHYLCFMAEKSRLEKRVICM